MSLALAPTAQAQFEPPLATSTPEIVKADPTLDNCYLYVLSQIPSLPHMADIMTNTSPHVGAVAFFDYDGTPHFAIITKLVASSTGFWVTDSNFGGPGVRTHFIVWSNPHLRGFWSP